MSSFSATCEDGEKGEGQYGGSLSGRNQEGGGAYEFELLLALLQREVLVDRRVLSRKLDDLGPVKVVRHPCVDLARELVEELDKELNLQKAVRGRRATRGWKGGGAHIDELHRGMRELVGDNVEEGFGAEGALVRTGLAPSGLEREES